MKEIKVQEASTTIETVKFEVGKTYVLQDICYTVISRTEKTATFTHETACSKVLGLGREKTTRKAIRHDDNGNEVVYGFSTFGRLEAIMDVHTYELTNNCLRVESNNFVSYDWSNTIDVESQEVTAEVENVTSDEEVTAEVKEGTEMKEFRVTCNAYTDADGVFVKKAVENFTNDVSALKFVLSFMNDLDDNNAIDVKFNDGKDFYFAISSDTVKTAREEFKALLNVYDAEEVTAENNVEIKKLEKKLASLKLFPLNTDEYMAACIDTIKNCYARIAQAEDKLWQFKLEKESYYRDVAALENEIVNRKLIDATDEIVMSDAVDASVAAMEELNAANFTTANLLDAVNAQAKNAVENIPVMFELQHFATDVNIAEDVATIDTAVSNTVIEPADEDDVKTQAYLAEIADIDAQIAALQTKRNVIVRAFDKHLERITDWAYVKIADAVKNWDADSSLILAPTLGNPLSHKLTKDNKLHFEHLDEGEFKISQRTCRLTTYRKAKQFKAAIRGLVAAIERGDEGFTFPPVIPPIAEVADSDAEIAKQIWF